MKDEYKPEDSQSERPEKPYQVVKIRMNPIGKGRISIDEVVE